MQVLEILLWISAGLWGVGLVNGVINRSLSWDLSRRVPPEPDRWPFISIVVPARNEERGIRDAVTSFCEQDYPSFEVIVVDDGSTDQTPRILEELKAKYSNLKVLKGAGPPEGWLGKPNALETGRREAKGEWMLFVDADVVYGSGLLRRAVSYVLMRDAGMLFVGPNLITGGFLEPIIMSTLYIVAAAMVPMFLVTRTRFKRFAVGGGVFNMVRRDALEASGAFESLKNAVVDDVGLGFKVKGAGHRLAAAMGGALIRIRMYYGARECIEGFSKNVYPTLRKLPYLFPVPFMLGALVSILPYVGLGISLAQGAVSTAAITALALMHVVSLGIVVFFRQPWFTMFFNPLRELIWWYIIFRSFFVFRRKGVAWRGRNYESVS